MTITAIETVYAGCRFRSRLEARWAVFFDRLGIKWQYEPQGWQMEDGTRYLPDFWLPEQQVNVEVKGGDEALNEDVSKLESFVRESNSLVLILGDVSRCPGDAPVHPMLGMVDGKFRSLASVFIGNSTADGWEAARLLADMPITTAALHVPGIQVSQVIANAYYAARSARFEHGESPEREGSA